MSVPEKLEVLLSHGVTVYALSNEEQIELKDLLDAADTDEKKDDIIQYFIDTHSMPTPQTPKSLSLSAAPTSKSSSSSSSSAAKNSPKDLALSVLRSNSLKPLFSSEFLKSSDLAAADKTNTDIQLGLAYLSYYSSAGTGTAEEDQTNRRIAFLRALIKVIRLKRAELKRNHSELFNKYSPSVSESSSGYIIDNEASSSSSSSSAPVAFNIDGFKRFVRQMEALSVRFVVAFQEHAFTKTYEKGLLKSDDLQSLFAALQETALLAYNVSAYEYSLAVKSSSSNPANLNIIRNEGRKAFSWIKELYSSFSNFTESPPSLSEISRLFAFVARSYVIQYKPPVKSALLDRMTRTVEFDIDDLRDYFYLIMERADVEALTAAETDKLLADLSEFEKNYAQLYQSNFAQAELYAELLSYLLYHAGRRGKEGSRMFWFEAFYILAIQSLRVGTHRQTSPYSPPLLEKEDLSEVVQNSEIRRGISFRFASPQQKSLGTAAQELEKEEKEEQIEAPPKKAKKPIKELKSPPFGARAQQKQITQNKQRIDDLFNFNASTSSSSSSLAIPVREAAPEDSPPPLELAAVSERPKKKKVIFEDEEDQEDQDYFEDEPFGGSPEYGLRKNSKTRAKHELYFGHHSEYVSLRRSPEYPY